LDKEKVRDAISATDMMTVMGPVKFDADGRSLEAPVVCSQWYQGKYRLVYPKESAGYNLGAETYLWPK
jgi:ABC-type branched-subunit amino acid transport system substrate-binding protein